MSGDLAARQAELVAAWSPVAPTVRVRPSSPGAAVPPAAQGGPGTWPDTGRCSPPVSPRLAGTFARWAAGRPTAGSLRDGGPRPRAAPPGHTAPLGAEELAVREAADHYDGRGRRAAAGCRLGTRRGPSPFSSPATYGYPPAHADRHLPAPCCTRTVGVQV